MKDTARLTNLDGLRGVASLIVALCHFVVAFHPTLLSGEIKSSHFSGDTWISHTGLILLVNPGFGVAIFFTLSGFVLASSVAERAIPMIALIIRRWLRLCLPILAVAIPTWCLVQVIPLHAAEAADLSHSAWLASTSAKFATTRVNIPNGFHEIARITWEAIVLLMITLQKGGDLIVRQQNSNLWTIPIEFIGSISLYAIYVEYRSARYYWPIRIGIAALLAIATWNTPFYGFGWGICLYEIWRFLPPEFIRRPGMAKSGAALLVAGICLGGAPFALNLNDDWFYAKMYLAVTSLGGKTNATISMHHAGAILLVASTLLFTPLSRFFNCGPCQYLGKISFMLYLVQIPVMVLLVPPLLLLLTPIHGYLSATACLLPLYLGVSIIIAHITTIWIDAPSINLSRKIGLKVAGWLSPCKPI